MTRLRTMSAACVVALVLTTGCSLASTEQGEQSTSPSAERATLAQADAQRGTGEARRRPGYHPLKPARGLFGPRSAWRLDVSRAPLRGDSRELVDNLAEQVATHYGGVAGFSVWDHNASVYVVNRGVRRRNVKFDNCQGKPSVPPQLYDRAHGAHFRDVPIPPDAVPARGSDGQLSIYEPRTGRLWEFWKAVKKRNGWHACWGGRINDAAKSPGFFRDGMGVSASGLSVAEGAVGINEMRARRITHAINLAVVDAAHWSEFLYPAQRSDGNMPRGTPHAIPEGQRFRLDPRIDVGELDLTPVARVVATAAQKYGFIVVDRAGLVSVGAESGAGASARRGRDPWGRLLQGVPSYAVMENFPWASLQAIRKNYGRKR